MSENSGNYDENDPKIKKKLEFLAEMDRKTTESITSWQDMYDGLKDVARIYMENPSKEHADFAVLTLLCFVLSLEQLPEEGDILVLAKRMNEVMIMRDDLTGACVYVGDEADAERSKANLLGAALLAKIAGTIEAMVETAGVAESAPIDKKTLH